MDAKSRIERALAASLGRGAAPGAPPGLLAAMQHAVFPGGARVRPRLCLAVATSCGGAAPLSVAAAAAIEFLHCASLVHDDLPCFDNADMRRGRASVHRAFGERLAVLAGDALIVLAFETLAATGPSRHLAAVIGGVARAVGAPHGIAAGQAWECEAEIDLAAYHAAKTGALFASACECGAASVGADGAAWRGVGEALGAAYQVADDLGDAAGDDGAMGKPAHQDAAHGRPSAVAAHGIAGALALLDTLAERAVASIPSCPGQAALRDLIRLEAHRLVPKQLLVAA